jgi:type I restriction enzyme S subunit
MASDWQSRYIKDVAEIYDGPHATPHKTAEGPWFLSISSLREGRLDLDESAHLSEEDYVRWTRRVAPQPGDVLFSYETRLGEAALMPGNLQACLGRRMGLLRPRQTEVNPRFLLYAYLAPQFQREINSRAVRGATVDRIPLNELGDWPIAIPGRSTQDAIAAVLGALEDKIENSRRISQIASSLAIAQGQSRLTDNGLVARLGEHAQIVKGVSYRSEDLIRGEGYLLNLKCVGRDGSFRSEGLKPYNGECRPEHIVHEGEVVVAQTDLTQRAEVIGRPVRIRNGDSPDRLVASLDLAIVRPREPLTNEFMLALLSTKSFRDHAISYCNGTTVLHMSARALPDYLFRMPSAEALREITSMMSPLLARSDAAGREAHAGAALRDTLLPPLVAGVLSVRDAEALAEEV